MNLSTADIKDITDLTQMIVLPLNKIWDTRQKVIQKEREQIYMHTHTQSEREYLAKNSR